MPKLTCRNGGLLFLFLAFIRKLNSSPRSLSGVELGLPDVLLCTCSQLQTSLSHPPLLVLLPIGRLTSARTVDLHRGEGHISFVDFNPNHNHVNAAPKQASLQTSSRPHHMQPPSKITVKYISFSRMAATQASCTSTLQATKSPH